MTRVPAPCSPHPAAPPPPAGRPLTPIVPINILNGSGTPVRSDNLTNFAYVGPNDGVTDPPEVYFAYHPEDPSNSTPIAPGETTYLKNAQTGKVGHLPRVPACCALLLVCVCWGWGWGLVMKAPG